MWGASTDALVALFVCVSGRLCACEVDPNISEPLRWSCRTKSTKAFWRLITALRTSCYIWKETIESFLRSIRQILCDIFIWLCSKKEMLFDFCLQSCTLLRNAATVSCERAKPALAALKCGWLMLVCFKIFGLTPTWLKCLDVISIFMHLYLHKNIGYQRRTCHPLINQYSIKKKTDYNNMPGFVRST